MKKQILFTLGLLVFNVYVSLPANAQVCANYDVGDALGRYSNQYGIFLLEDSDNSGLATEIRYGEKNINWKGIAGDWNGDGWDTIGTYSPTNSTFFLRNTNSPGVADVTFIFNPIDTDTNNSLIPLSGDWNGNGVSTVGLFDPSTSIFYLLNRNSTSSSADYVFQFGPPQSNWLPITGDWNDDGRDTIGLYSPVEGKFYLRNSNTGGTADISFRFGPTNASHYLPVSGNWDNQGGDTVGVFNNKGAVFFTNIHSGGENNITYYLSTGTMELTKRMTMVTGKWKPTQCRAPGESAVPSDTVTPDWVKDAIIYQMRIETFSSDDGTFKEAIQKLDHLVDLGVSVLYVTPVFENLSEGVGGITCGGHNLGAYSPKDLTRIESCLERGGVGLKAFVDAAHTKGLKVILDIITHGISKESVHRDTLPDDWFVKNPDGTIYLNPKWGNTPQWNWTNPDFRNWYIQNVVVNSVKNYGVDGFRWDLEPSHAGMLVIKKAREEVLAQAGKKIFMMTESYMKPPHRGSKGYSIDLSQQDYGYLDEITGTELGGLMNLFDGTRNVVNEIKTGVLKDAKYVGSTLSYQAFATYSARGNLGRFVYGGLISPFIPQISAGEEFNNSFSSLNSNHIKLFFTSIDWNKLQTNNTFYQQVKKLIQIRKDYKDIIRPFETRLSDTRIKNITQYSGTDLQPYVMWKDNTAIIVIAKNNAPAGNVSITFPLQELGWTSGTVYWRDLMTDSDIGSGPNYTKSVYVPSRGATVLKVSTSPHPAPTFTLTTPPPPVANRGNNLIAVTTNNSGSLSFQNCAFSPQTLDSGTTSLSLTSPDKKLYSHCKITLSPYASGEPSQTLTLPNFTLSHRADLNRDRKVDIFDFNLLVSHFGKNECNNVADLNNDCKVDIFDFNLFLGEFGRSV